MAEVGSKRKPPAVQQLHTQTSKTLLLPSQQQPGLTSLTSSRFSFTPFTGKRYDDVVAGTPRMLRMMASPVTGEEHGGSEGVLVGLLTFMLIGCIIGALLPKNEQLPTPWYRTVSACIGYAYFVCWAVSFYPQALTNFRRKTTVGLSADFCALNVLGFACYASYNVALFFSGTVQDQYRIRHGPDSHITVQSNDVAFAVHAFVLSSITLLQIGYYDGFHDRISKEVGVILVILILVIVFGFSLVVLAKRIAFLDFFYLLSYIKILITLLKYLPQIVLNFQRKSTHGFSIWQILLDFSGGILSITQLVLDCLDLRDLSGLTGNLAKFLLGAISVVLDTIIMLQHYIWFPAQVEDVRHGPRVTGKAFAAEEPPRKQQSLEADNRGHASHGFPFYRSTSM